MDQTSVINLVLMLSVTGLALAANLGERSRGWRLATYGLMVLFAFGVLVLGLFNLGAAVLLRAEPTLFPEAELAYLQALNPARLGLWLLAGSLASVIVLLPPVRRGLSRILPLRSDSIVNAVAVGLLIILVVQAIGVGGLGPEGFVSLTGSISLSQVISGQIPLVLAGIAGVGFLVRRNGHETLERLGLSGLSWRQFGLTIAGLIGLLGFEFALDAVGSRVAPQSFARLSAANAELYAALGAPFAAVIVSLASGICEEILFRGALQPRFGLVTTALVFGIIHMQYGMVWALLSIGVIGLVLGLYRQKINTTACILIHVLYNLTTLLVSGL